MPRGDRTGPNGAGPMTGRRAGYCSGYDMPGFANPIPGGAGFGAGRGYRGRGYGGGGRGYRNRFYQTAVPPVAVPVPEYSREQELSMLKQQADSLEAAMNDVLKRIKELEKTDK